MASEFPPRGEWQAGMHNRSAKTNSSIDKDEHREQWCTE